MSDNIQVAIRLRPSNQKHRYWVAKSRCIYQIDENGAQIGEPYYFDHIFDNKSNKEIYETVVQPLILSTIDGFNATVFAYGQTSTGKTYTMFGSNNVPGIMHMAVKDLFESVEKHSEWQFNIRASYLEIYNERINDLLDPSREDIRLRHDYFGNQILPIKEIVVHNSEQVFNVICQGAKNRKIGETEMNERSSRSHTIFRIQIESTRPEGILQISILNLVDLAGSERLAQTKSEGARLKEGVNINKSLLTLGIVIKQLSENEKCSSKFINFRDSKLTRLLQPALGGNAKTLIIATVTTDFIDETSSTLSFAQRAKTVKNKPEIKEIVPNDYCRQIKMCEERAKILQEENEQLHKIIRESKDKLKVLQPHAVSLDVVQQRRRHTICSRTTNSIEEVEEDQFLPAQQFFENMTPSKELFRSIEETPREERLKELKIHHLEETVDSLEQKLNEQIELYNKKCVEFEQMKQLNIACDTKIIELTDELTEKENFIKNMNNIVEDKDYIMSKLLMLEKLLINCNYSQGSNENLLKELYNKIDENADNCEFKEIVYKLNENLLKQDYINSIIEENYKKIDVELLIKCLEQDKNIKLDYLDSLKLKNNELEMKMKEILNEYEVLKEKLQEKSLEQENVLKKEYFECLKLTINEFETNLKLLTSENDKKLTELHEIIVELKENDLKILISNLDDDKIVKNDYLESLKLKICELETELKENPNENGQLREITSFFQEKFDAMEKILDEFKEKDMNTIIKIINEDKQFKKEYLESLKLKNNELETKLKEILEENNELRKQFQQKDKKADVNMILEFLEQNNTKIESVDNLKSKNYELEMKLKEVLIENGQLKEKLQKTESNTCNESMELLIKKLEKNYSEYLNSLKLRNSELETKITQLLSENEELKTNSLQSDTNLLVKHLEQVKIDYFKNVKSGNNELEAQLKELSTVNDKKLTQILRTVEELKQNDVKNRLEDDNKTKTEQLNKLKSLNRDLEAKFNEKLSEFEREKAELLKKLRQTELSNQTESFKMELMELKQQIEAKEKLVNSLEMIKNDLTEKCKDCEAKLIGKNKEIESIRKDLLRSKRDCEIKDISINRLENMIKSLKDDSNNSKSLTMQPSIYSNGQKIYTSRDLLRRPIIPPPVRQEIQSTDTDSKVMELQIVIYDLQKKETQLTNEIKLLREKNEQLENHLKSNQENMYVLQSKYDQVKAICSNRGKEILKLRENK